MGAASVQMRQRCGTICSGKGFTDCLRHIGFTGRYIGGHDLTWEHFGITDQIPIMLCEVIFN